MRVFVVVRPEDDEFAAVVGDYLREHLTCVDVLADADLVVAVVGSEVEMMRTMYGINDSTYGNWPMRRPVQMVLTRPVLPWPRDGVPPHPGVVEVLRQGMAVREGSMLEDLRLVVEHVKAGGTHSLRRGGPGRLRRLTTQVERLEGRAFEFPVLDGTVVNGASLDEDGLVLTVLVEEPEENFLGAFSPRNVTDVSWRRLAVRLVVGGGVPGERWTRVELGVARGVPYGLWVPDTFVSSGA